MGDNNFKFEIDIDQLTAHLKDAKAEAEAMLTDAVKAASVMTYAKAQELAGQRLKSRLKEYKEALKYKEISAGLWVVELDEKALWIEDGKQCVVYNPFVKKHIPRILTPDGYIPITDIKIGNKVLNQNGKWTEVIAIFDDHLVFDSKMIIEKIEICNYSPNNFKLNKRKNLLFFNLSCPKCHYSYKLKKLKTNQINKGMHCPKCYTSKELVEINLTKGLISETCQSKKLTLTSDHRVMTENGWLEIGKFTKENEFKTPSWNECRVCNKKVPGYRSICHSKLGASVCRNKEAQTNILKENKHISQNPNWLSQVYLKTLKNLKKISGTEEVVADLLKNEGYNIKFNNEELEGVDCIRQYAVPSSTDCLGRQKYYFLDFYFPNLGLNLEIDGKGFHNEEKDKIRDSILANMDIQTFRINAKKVRNKNFLKECLKPILSNHEGNITYLPLKSKTIKTFPAKSTALRRWDITVKDGESFVIEGILVHNSGSMVDDLLRKNPKINKKGERYKVIPFDQGDSARATSTTGETANIVKLLKSELKARGVPFKGIEKNADGTPKLGKLHTMNIQSPKPTEKASTPALYGLTIYQRMNARGKVKRDIMTFRIVNDEAKRLGKWFYPGKSGVKIFDEVYAWLNNEWESNIYPDIEKRFNK